VLDVLDTAYQPILTAIGQGLAALHTTSGPLDRLAPPTAIVAELRQRVQHLYTWMPAAACALHHIVACLARHAPPAVDMPTLVHGDFGPAQLLWDDGRLAMLDFDRCGLGDPALDLGTLLAQLRRRALMRVGTTPDLAELRTLVLEAYHRNGAQSSGFAERVAWYERVVLLRKVHFLAAQDDGEKRAQAMALLRLLAGLTEAHQPDC
jgi:aminoglycoside phosphotransferase (APT) family kinase protein